MRKFSSQSGTSVTIVLVSFVFVIFLGIVVVQGWMWLTRGSAAKAETELNEFAQQLGWDLLGRSCAGIDSDKDGYISCTARVRENGSTTEKPLECASGALFSWTDGCKLAYQFPKQQ